MTGKSKPAVNSGKLSGVQRDKRSHVFVTRLSPACEEADIADLIRANLDLDAEVEKNSGTNHDEYFSSFHVFASVNLKFY